MTFTSSDFNISLEDLLQYDLKLVSFIIEKEVAMGRVEKALFLLDEWVKSGKTISNGTLRNMRDSCVTREDEEGLDQITKWATQNAQEEKAEERGGVCAAVLQGNLEVLKKLLASGGSLLEEMQDLEAEKAGGKKLDVLGVKSKNGYQTGVHSALYYSIVVGGEDVAVHALNCVKTSNELEHAKLVGREFFLTALKQKNKKVVQAVFDVPEFRRENMGIMIPASDWMGRVQLKGITWLRDDQIQMFEDRLKDLSRGEKLWATSKEFRRQLILHWPKKYMEYLKSYDANTPDKIHQVDKRPVLNLLILDTETALKLRNVDLLNAMYEKHPSVLNWSTLDYPKQDRRTSRTIGIVLHSLLQGNDTVLKWALSFPGMWEAEQERIKEYEKKGWLLTRTQGIHQQNQLTEEVDKRGEHARKMLENARLTKDIIPSAEKKAKRAL
jgi:hypothetical protein